MLPQGLRAVAKQHGLYRRRPPRDVPDADAVPHRIPLPGQVPIGTYEIEIKLFANGALVAKTESAFEIVKVGFEQFVATPRSRTA